MEKRLSRYLMGHSENHQEKDVFLFPNKSQGSEECRENFRNKTLPKSFVFLCHFCHFSRIPFPQRAERVAEEVTVAVLLSP
jgi:hypothetical protein